MRDKKRFEAAVKTSFCEVIWKGVGLDEPHIYRDGFSTSFDPETNVEDCLMFLEMEMLSAKIVGLDGGVRIDITEYRKPPKGNYKIVETKGRPFNDDTIGPAFDVMMDKIIDFCAKRNGYVPMYS